MVLKRSPPKGFPFLFHLLDGITVQHLNRGLGTVSILGTQYISVSLGFLRKPQISKNLVESKLLRTLQSNSQQKHLMEQSMNVWRKNQKQNSVRLKPRFHLHSSVDSWVKMTMVIKQSSS